MACKRATRKRTKRRAPERRVRNEKQTQISLCMIVKDEEEFLPGCLVSVKGVADEIVVVDTGSTDRTVEIAREFGARVYHYRWDDDFAAARNESLKHATCGWILVLDADERLAAGAGGELRAVAEGKGVKAIYAAKIVNYGTPGGETEHYFPRFFPNHAGIQYEGIVHERPTPSVSSYLSAGCLPRRLKGFVLLHHGYEQDVVKNRDKKRRNIVLLQKILEGRDDPYYRYKLGSMLFTCGRASEAIRELERVFAALDAMDADERSRASVGRVDVLLLLSRAYSKQGLDAEATRLIDRALGILPWSKEALHQKAAFLFNAGLVAEARSIFLAIAEDRRADRADTAGEQLVFDTSMDTWKPITMAARCSMHMGDMSGAIELMTKATEFIPRSDECIETASRLVLDIDRQSPELSERDEKNVSRLRGVLREEADIRVRKADELFERGELTGAVQLYAASMSLEQSADGASLVKLARAQLLLGDADGAFTTYLRALRSLPTDAESLNLLIELTRVFRGAPDANPESVNVLATAT
ncbi:MAG: glycosyltransferase [Bacillota bacterium]